MKKLLYILITAFVLAASASEYKANANGWGFSTIQAGAFNGAKAFLGNFYIDDKGWFFNGVWQGVSRHTWEMPQSLIGHGYTQARNIFGYVDRIDYFGGATFATNEYAAGNDWGVSLGNYININNVEAITGNFKDYVLTHAMYMHEYGHTFDSRLFGPAYLFGIGIPSTSGARWTEIRANRYAKKYFGKYYRVDWNSLNINGPYRWVYINGEYVKQYYTFEETYPTN